MIHLNKSGKLSKLHEIEQGSAVPLSPSLSFARMGYYVFMPVDTIDYSFPEPVIRGSARWFVHRVFYPEWEKFLFEHVDTIFRIGGFITDIGGGLRIDASRSNRVNLRSEKFFRHYLSDPNVRYRITDYTDQYHPDFVEDIHRLTFPDSSQDAVICMAVLEHVYDPKRAAEEIVRVLKPGGRAFIYVPFIYRYHAHAQDYRDYFRYSKDGIAYLFRTCRSIELCPVRGLFESLLRFLPLCRIALFNYLARSLDESLPVLRRIGQRQTSGYFVSIVK